jgi:hypothetical protein
MAEAHYSADSAHFVPIGTAVVSRPSPGWPMTCGASFAWLPAVERD